MGFGWVGGQEGSHNSEEKAVEGVEKLAEGSQLVFRQAVSMGRDLKGYLLVLSGPW